MPWAEDVSRLSAAVGDGTLRLLSYVGGLSKLCLKAFAYVLLIRPRRWGHGARFTSAVHQAMLVGVSALPILSLIVFFIGVIMAMQLSHELEQFGAAGLIASGVAVGMTRELGPFMTAVVVLGRSGSAFAAEIGTMKVNQELDALATMALDPVRFLVTPKLVAMLVMMPCLMSWSNLMGVLGGALFGVTRAGYSLRGYLESSLDSLYMEDIVSGLVKSLMFGVVITGVGCYEGFTTGVGPEEVGRSTTAAVVKSIFLVIVVDLVFTALFYFTQAT